MPKVQDREKYMYLPGMYVDMYVCRYIVTKLPNTNKEKKGKKKELHGFCWYKRYIHYRSKVCI